MSSMTTGINTPTFKELRMNEMEHYKIWISDDVGSNNKTTSNETRDNDCIWANTGTVDCCV